MAILEDLEIGVTRGNVQYFKQGTFWYLNEYLIRSYLPDINEWELLFKPNSCYSIFTESIVYLLLLRRIDSGRISRLSTSHAASSPFPSVVKIKLQEVKSVDPGPTFSLAVKNAFFPSKAYFPLSIICTAT